MKWLVQAEILKDSKSKKITELGQLLASNYPDMPDMVWQIIWINLSYNSPIAAWYKERVNWEEIISQKEIEERVLADYSDNSKTTVHNVVYALFRTFKESPIGDAGQLVPKIRQCLYEHLMNHWNVRRSFIRFINIVKEKAYILFVLVTCMQVTTIGDFIKNLAYLK